MSSTQPIPAKLDRIVWIDLEMTGLDIHRHTIVEIAALVTDSNLNVLGDGIDLVIHASDAELAEMDDFVTEMHTSSGLVDAIKASTVTLEEAEDAVLALIDKHCDPEHPAPLAGNSIATDRAFIRQQMPRLDQALHYRMLDVSTLKELSHRWLPDVYYGQPKKGLAHRALADIVESIRELAYYRKTMLASEVSREDIELAANEVAANYQQVL